VIYLEEMLEPVTLDEFREKYLFREPYAAPLNAGRFRNLIGWPLLWEILSTGHPDCWLPKEGRLPSEPQLASGRLTFDQAALGYQQGRTLLVRHAEKAHGTLQAIAANFHDLFRGAIDIQLYCTPAGEEGFDWHYDVEHVFVIQSSGQKEFRLRKNTVSPRPLKMMDPKEKEFEREPRAPEIRCHLAPGDWLYIPAGWWHKAKAVSNSFHLSIGVML
jgi:ribosomal protein L16 Arg81 hydroxylase